MAKDGHTPPLLWSMGPSLTYSREIEHQSSTLITYGEVIHRSRWTHGVRKRQTVPNFIGPREAEKEGSQNRGCEPPDEQEQQYPDEKLVHTYKGVSVEGPARVWDATPRGSTSGDRATWPTRGVCRKARGINTLRWSQELLAQTKVNHTDIYRFRMCNCIGRAMLANKRWVWGPMR